jgi:thiol:disulfide interchange protein
MRFFKTLFLVFIASCFFNINISAQEKIVQWGTATEKQNNVFKLNFTGKIKNAWHVYATPNSSADISGITLQAEDSFVSFKNYQLKSVPTISVNDVLATPDLQIINDSVSFFVEAFIKDSLPEAFNIYVNYEVADKASFYPESDTLKIITGAKVQLQSSNRILIPTIQLDKPLSNCKTEATTDSGSTKSKGYLSIFFIGFLGGLVALLTPCVFPMIPLTVSFFTKKAASRNKGIQNAMLYGFFIFFIYVLLSLPFHFIDKLDPSILNGISTNVYLNIIFFIIFIVFALSFFGFYEITLPASFTNKTDSKAGVGNALGIFFMALTLAIVSFSCTGPILGSLLAGSLTTDGGAMQLTAGMAGFGFALALPFALFALFPGMLSSLPKSGGWLTTVKVVLGFLELGLALKFLSNADLVKHWGLLKREIFIGIWIIIGVLLSLYLWGILKFKHDSPIKKLSKMRIAFALLSTAFTIYLIPGVTNTTYANLKLISGFPPPLYYSIYSNGDCVLNLNCTHDYETGLKMAKEQNKAVLLDFTGYACTNCRRMEENVWSDEAVYKVLKEKFIVVSLYVDDKKLLPAGNRITYKTKDGAVRNIRTVGDKWSVFETENFNENSQPLYAIINTKEELVSKPSGYAPNKKDYLQWLNCSLEAIQKK